MRPDLPQLYDALSSELAKLGRLQWLEDELLRRQLSQRDPSPRGLASHVWDPVALRQKIGNRPRTVDLCDQRAEQKNMPAR